jgi:hypothetical protein
MEKKNYNIVDEIDIQDDDPAAETKLVENRAEFGSNTIIALYKSVGGLCSQCHRYTVARNPKTGKFVSIGEAAHIFGAKRSKGSPRPNYEMTNDELRSFENGIWLCRNCHRQIDYDQDFFNSDDLVTMKRSAEQLAYDLLNKDIDIPYSINYEIFELSHFNNFQLCLIHFELTNVGVVSFDLEDEDYWIFEDELFKAKKYNRFIPFIKGMKNYITGFRWDTCWDSFLKIGFGECFQNSYSINNEKLQLLVYRDYSFLLKNPEVEKQIQSKIPDILNLNAKEATYILDYELECFEESLIFIWDDFIRIIEKKLGFTSS